MTWTLLIFVGWLNNGPPTAEQVRGFETEKACVAAAQAIADQYDIIYPTAPKADVRWRKAVVWKCVEVLP